MLRNFSSRWYLRAMLAAGISGALAALAPAALAQNLSIQSPVNGMAVAPGQQLSIVAEASNGFTPVMAVALTTDIAIPLSVPGLAGTLAVASDTAGALNVEVGAVDAGGNLELAQVTVFVTPSTTLTGITVSPPRIEITSRSMPTTQLSVTGTFADGSTIDLSPGSSGTSYSSDTPSVATVDANGVLTATGIGFAGITIFNENFQFFVPAKIDVQPGVLVASVLPSSRSVQIGHTATAFATIINSGQAATSCSISPLLGIPATFSYQTTDAANRPTGTPNTPVDIPSGQAQSFVFSLTPTQAFDAMDTPLDFNCTNTTAAPVTVGLDTLLLSGSTVPVPDVIALGATLSHDGVVHVPGPSGSNAFAVATDNIGSGAMIVATADTGGQTLPLSINLCQTNPATGACVSAIGPSVNTTMNADSTGTFTIVATSMADIPFDPANSRIFVRFIDTNGVTRGSTSVAVTTE
jgi:Bacterial Ig-like domain (group 2)